jgi:DNA-binding HxlR family transcriptional regulator
VPDYGNFCPIALGSEVLADRWTPLIVRELILGSTRFNDIARGLPGISRTLLTQRLRHLERKGVIERRPTAGRGSEYQLTDAGRDLESVLLDVGRWAVQWLYDDFDHTDVDAITLTWWMHRRVDADRLPDRRVVLELDHTGPEPVTVWMVFERREASVCIQPPGFDVDLIVRCTTPDLAAVFSGVDTWRRAVSTGAIAVEGLPALARELPRWFLWSPFVDHVRAHEASVSRPA